MHGLLSKRDPPQFVSRGLKLKSSDPNRSFLSLCFIVLLVSPPQSLVFVQLATYDATHPARLLLSPGAGRYRPSYSSRFVRVKSWAVSFRRYSHPTVITRSP